MAKSVEDVKQMQQKTLDTAIEFVRLAVENAEKLAHLQLDTARLVLQTSVEKAKSVAQPVEVTKVTSSDQVQKVVREAVDYSRQLSEIGQQAQERLIALAKENQAAMDQEVRKALDRVIQQMPTADEWTASVQAMMASAAQFAPKK